jgi:hypothetical protein
MFSGHGLELGLGSIGPWQELVDAAIGMAVDDPGDDVGEIGLGINAPSRGRHCVGLLLGMLDAGWYLDPMDL